MISVYNLIVSIKQNFLDTKNTFFSKPAGKGNIKLRSSKYRYVM